MAENEQQQMDDPESQDSNSQIGEPLKRLIDQRWVLIIVGLGLCVLVLRAHIPWSTGLVFFVATGLAAMVEPASSRRRKQLAALKAARKTQTTSVWPDSATKRALSALPTPTLLTDSNGVVRFLNGGASVLMPSVTPGDALSLHMRQKPFLAALDTVTRTNQQQTLDYFERVPVERWFRVTIAPLQFPSEQVQNTSQSARFILIQLEDDSEQRRTERMRVDFIANASHELRTPLASVSGFIETLLGPARNDAEARERFLNIMREQAERMSRLIDDLLSLSRIELKAHVRPRDLVDLASITQRTIEVLTPLATQNDVKLVLTVAPQTSDHAYHVRGDEDELTQVISNLIENAIKYGASGGRIEITVTMAPRGGASLSVRDFGPGIAAEHVPRVTERFYRVDVETSREKKGTGLGLAIVKHILNRHDARLDVKSIFGEGATFTVVFPKQAQMLTPADQAGPRASE